MVKSNKQEAAPPQQAQSTGKGHSAPAKASGNKKALGKGLSALLPEKPLFHIEPGEQVEQIALTAIMVNPEQPRQHFDEQKLAELAESIREHGVIQPLLLMPSPEGDGGYWLIAGERRFRAARLAGLEKVPCLVRQVDRRSLAELALLENIQREDLSPLEEAAAYRRLLDEYGYTQEDLAARLGKSRPHLTNTLRLLQLSGREKQLLTEGKISAGHARALLALKNPEQRAYLAQKIANEGLSVREAERYVQQAQLLPLGRSTAPGRRQSPFAQQLSQKLGERLGVKAQLSGGSHKGKLVLEYQSEDDLQRLIEALLPGERF